MNLFNREGNCATLCLLTFLMSVCPISSARRNGALYKYDDQGCQLVLQVLMPTSKEPEPSIPGDLVVVYHQGGNCYDCSMSGSNKDIPVVPCPDAVLLPDGDGIPFYSCDVKSCEQVDAAAKACADMSLKWAYTGPFGVKQDRCLKM